VRGSGDARNPRDLETLAPSEVTFSASRGGRPPTHRYRPRRQARLLAVSAVVISAVIGGGVGWQVRASRAVSTRRSLPLPVSQRTVVPNVIGMSPWDAEAALARWGLASGVDQLIDGKLTEGSRVFAQEPGAGEHVPVGSIVGLRAGQARQEVGPSFRSFGTLHTRFGDAVMVCGEEAMPACGIGTDLEFVPPCSDALRVFFRYNDGPMANAKVRAFTGRPPPSGTRWTFGCGRDFRSTIKRP
jgi:hypothetical protein